MRTLPLFWSQRNFLIKSIKIVNYLAFVFFLFFNIYLHNYIFPTLFSGQGFLLIRHSMYIDFE